MARVERLQPLQRAGAAPGRATFRRPDDHPPPRGLRLGHRGRAPVAPRTRRHRRRIRRTSSRHGSHPTVGLVDELLHDDRLGRRYRLLPVHRLALPRGTRRRQESGRRYRRHTRHRREGRVSVGTDRCSFTGRGLPCPRHGLSVDGPRHDPRRRRRGHRCPHPSPRCTRVAR